MRIIRASEIGTYIYCARAWWYHTQGVRSENQVELDSGSEFHRRHGRLVLTARLMKLAGWLLLLVALVLLTVGLTLQWLK
jgi:hypothetical protein